MKRGIRKWRYGSPILLVFVLVIVHGCGFHLRGVASLPPSVSGIFVEQQQAPLIAESLSHAFIEQQLPLVEDKALAQVFIRVFQERYQRRVLSVDASGKVQQYELDYTVNLQILDSKGQALATPQTLSLTRDQRYDSSQVLAMASEEQSLKKEILEDAARQIIRRLQFINPSQNSQSAAQSAK